MKIYEAVAKEVCHQICHGVYESVKGQALMLNDTEFTFTTKHDETIDVDFYPDHIIITQRGKKIRWNTEMELIRIADSIVKCAERG